MIPEAPPLWAKRSWAWEKEDEDMYFMLPWASLSLAQSHCGSVLSHKQVWFVLLSATEAFSGFVCEFELIFTQICPVFQTSAVTQARQGYSHHLMRWPDTVLRQVGNAGGLTDRLTGGLPDWQPSRELCWAAPEQAGSWMTGACSPLALQPPCETATSWGNQASQRWYYSSHNWNLWGKKKKALCVSDLGPGKVWQQWELARAAQGWNVLGRGAAPIAHWRHPSIHPPKCTCTPAPTHTQFHSDLSLDWIKLKDQRAKLGHRFPTERRQGLCSQKPAQCLSLLASPDSIKIQPKVFCFQP